MQYLNYFLLTLAAILPSIFWVWFFRRYDWKNPEPRILITQLFIWGILIGLPAVFFEKLIEKWLGGFSVYPLFFIFKAFLIVALIEEFLKFLVVRKKIYKHSAFDEPIDGVIYCITVALGFAAFENVAVLFSQGEMTVLLRSFTTTLMHALTAGVLGYFIGLARFNFHKQGILFFMGLFCAVALHGFYNIIASQQSHFVVIYLIILLVIMYLVLRDLIKKANERDLAIIGKNDLNKLIKQK